MCRGLEERVVEEGGRRGEGVREWVRVVGEDGGRRRWERVVVEDGGRRWWERVLGEGSRRGW